MENLRKSLVLSVIVLFVFALVIGGCQKFINTETDTSADKKIDLKSEDYMDNSDNTITDNTTGLIWQKEDDATKRKFDNAVSFCDDLSLGGYSDWRLPNIYELRSIVNYENYDLAINPDYFPNTKPADYCTSTLGFYEEGSYKQNLVMCVDFSDGYVDGDGKNEGSYTRCVRGDGELILGLFDYVDNGETIADQNTGLIWQRENDDQKYTWETAIAYCEALTLGGYSDWHLPDIYELGTIVDHQKYNPAIDLANFPNTATEYYWSSSNLVNDDSIAWRVNFGNGVIVAEKIGKDYEENYYVRCVR